MLTSPLLIDFEIASWGDPHLFFTISTTKDLIIKVTKTKVSLKRRDLANWLVTIICYFFTVSLDIFRIYEIKAIQKLATAFSISGILPRILTTKVIRPSCWCAKILASTLSIFHEHYLCMHAIIEAKRLLDTFFFFLLFLGSIKNNYSFVNREIIGQTVHLWSVFTFLLHNSHDFVVLLQMAEWSKI